eukprot:1101084-Amphidinium_carterae.1
MHGGVLVLALPEGSSLLVLMSCLLLLLLLLSVQVLRKAEEELLKFYLRMGTSSIHQSQPSVTQKWIRSAEWLELAIFSHASYTNLQPRKL